MKIKNLLVSVFILATVFAFNTEVVDAKGGGGRGGGGARSSSVRSSTPRASATPKISTPKTPKAPSISKTPSKSTVKVTAPVAKKVGGKTFSKKGSVVDATYQPKFNGGYTPPIGSTVYYRQSSALDWLPFYLILNSQNAHREAIVTEPSKDGQPAVEKVVKEEGLDTMYIVNWVMSILVIIGFIWLVVYIINKKTNKNYYA